MQPSDAYILNICCDDQLDQASVCQLVFGGDVILKRQHQKKSQQPILDQHLTKLFQDADFSGINMEAPLEDIGSEMPKSGPAICMDGNAPEILKSLGVDWVSMANNHAMDFGAVAMAGTQKQLENQGIGAVGAGQDETQAHQILEHVLPNGVKLAIVSVCEHEFGIAEGHQPGVAWAQSPRVIEHIQKAKAEGRYVIVCSHGGVEEVPLPPIERQAQLRAYIDAGADLIIGHHPHVPQGWELYQGKAIFYSLGDLVFDHNGAKRKHCRDWGYLVDCQIDGRARIDLKIHAYERVADTVVPLGAERDAGACLDYLKQNAGLIGSAEFARAWQAIADDLFEKRYEPFLEFIFQPLAEPRSVSQAAGCLWRSIKSSVSRRLGWGRSEKMTLADVDQDRQLLLLNLLQCESHYQSILRALSSKKLDRNKQAQSLRLMELMYQL